MSGAICGGIISQSMLIKAMKKDVYSCMMSFVLADDKYKLYIKYSKEGNKKKAKEIFDNYAVSQI